MPTAELMAVAGGVKNRKTIYPVQTPRGYPSPPGSPTAPPRPAPSRPPEPTPAP